MDSSLISLYNEIENHECLEVVNRKMRSRVALVRQDGLIAIDYSQIHSEAEEKEKLIEEIDHFEVAALYDLTAPSYVWKQQENRRKRHTFEKRFPPEELAKLMLNGHVESYEISEELGLPERFVKEMLLFYTEICGINFNTLAAQLEWQEAEPEVIEEIAIKEKPVDNTIQFTRPSIEKDSSHYLDNAIAMLKELDMELEKMDEIEEFEKDQRRGLTASEAVAAFEKKYASNDRYRVQTAANWPYRGSLDVSVE